MVLPETEVIVTVSYWVELLKLGAKTRVSPTAQSVLLRTVIVVSPAKALAVNRVLTVVGALPYNLTLPVTTNILLP